MKTLPRRWTAAIEAAIFTGWIYDHLKPHAAAVKVAHPLMLRAIAVAKKKNDRIDANKIADCLRCDFLPECYTVSTEIRERRRTLRHRNLLVRQAVQMKNKIAVLLMEAGVSCNKRKLHKVGLLPGTAGDQPGHRRRAETVSALVLRNGSSSREDRKCTGARSPTGSIAARPRGTAHDDSCGRSDHGTDLGTGSWRRAAIFFNQKGHQLLRVVRRREELCEAPWGRDSKWMSGSRSSRNQRRGTNAS